MADDTIPIQPSPCTYRHHHHLYFRPVITKRPSSPLLYSRHQIHLSQGAGKREIRYSERRGSRGGGLCFRFVFPVGMEDRRGGSYLHHTHFLVPFFFHLNIPKPVRFFSPLNLLPPFHIFPPPLFSIPPAYALPNLVPHFSTTRVDFVFDRGFF